MTGPTMDEFFAVLEACGARRVTRQEELEPLRSAWSEHRRDVAGRDHLQCAGCDERVDRPYAVWDGQTSYCWCIKCAPAMAVFSSEGDDGHDQVVGMHNFARVIVCAPIGPVSPEGPQ